MGRKSRFLILMLCGAILLSACGEKKQAGPEAVLARFVQCWEQGNWAEMYKMLSQEAQNACSEEIFCSRYENISAGIGLVKLNLSQVKYEEAQLYYTLEFVTSTVGSFCQDYTMEAVAALEGWELDWDHCHIFPELTAQRIVRVSRQFPQRGRILDRNNIPLASSGSVYNIGLVPGSMDENAPERLALILGSSETEIRKLLNQSWVRESTFVPIQVLGAQEWFELRQALTAIKGVLVREKECRVYDIPESMAQTIGHVGEIEANRLEELSALGFDVGDMVGQAGLELAYDRILAGRPGFTVVILEGKQTISVLAKQEPSAGQDIETTLDLAKIRLLDSVLGDKTGSMLLMDFTSGDILGVVSKPGFDSNLFAQGITPSQYQGMVERDFPFFNRAFNGLYPPGSVFKPFTALMALEQGVFDPKYGWDTPQRWQVSNSWGAYQVTRVLRPLGPVDLWDAMKWSDNVYFADLGVKVGWEAFENYAKALGFEGKIPFSLNYRRSKVRDLGWGEILLADSSYGQGEMLVTPLHMALMYSAIARRDGTIPVPRLVDTDQRGVWLETDLDSENLELMDRVLAYAASDYDALTWVGSDTVRGKTGTSEISPDRQIAWYICYFDDFILTVNLEGGRELSSLHAVALARECLAMGIRDK